MTDEILAWHFVGETLRDGSPIPADGVPLKFEGKLIICQSGLHATERIFDALSYAPGHTICRVACRGIGERHYDQFVCAERTILWRVDGEQILRQFSRRVALDVVHLWDAPDIVKQYLETGDESIRAAAWAAAWDAARDAAWAAALAAARAAAWDAARGAARGAAWGAARAAAWDAAGDAARGAAWAAAWDAARDANISKYNDWLTDMVESAHAATGDTSD